MTIDLLGYDEPDFYDGVTTAVGAASAFEEVVEADILACLSRRPTSDSEYTRFYFTGW